MNQQKKRSALVLVALTIGCLMSGDRAQADPCQNTLCIYKGGLSEEAGLSSSGGDLPGYGFGEFDGEPRPVFETSPGADVVHTILSRMDELVAIP